MSKIMINQDKEMLDDDFIYNYLKDAYWAKGRTMEMVQTTIRNSICFGVYKDNRQIGFARVVSDKAVFAYIMDVFILPEQQGNGYGSELMSKILNDSELKNVQNWLLAISDAHGLYQKFGFKALPNPDKIMGKVSF